MKSTSCTLFTIKQGFTRLLAVGHVALLLACGQAFAVTSDADAAVDTWINMQGSSTIGKQLTPKMAHAYLETKGITDIAVSVDEKQHTTVIKGYDAKSDRFVQVRIASKGSSSGFAGLQKGNADIAASSRPIKASEADELKALGNMTASSSEHVIAVDGLSIIVHPSNPVVSLTTEQLKKIFNGSIKNWSQVGGVKGKISVFARNDGSGTMDTFNKLVLGKGGKLAKSAKRQDSNEKLSAAVQADALAIGFVGLSSVGDSKAVAIAADEEVQAMYPNRLTLATEDYPLARRLYLYTPKEKSQPVNEFIQFVQQQQAQKLVDATGYVSQNIERFELEIADDLPDYYREAVSGADRLSLNFRFAEGKAKLDSKALEDIKRLASYMSAPENKQSKLILVGSSDPSNTAVLISKLRAKKVRTELVKQGVAKSRIEMVANGALMQVAGNDSLSSRIKNRRVEAWLR
ncbi:phosphate ABC transporter substrate-binding/OmpA family protein [Aestuariirhabdus sp. Z084]|uniref:substrate-binding domain-containing protein n=1 Tax=Aestuariirhabdus haliotis TaxID=2918751 RepID=UPI00201B370B|nr:phosphate ABC transporter substrate-binding/OmpA family protein [Aestuariirhabdus haliotis]MCL6416949.1 phosphate ABC transporter substrate-binding/OmpA family protein [Aestuariirhabdus haliotis]MCL6420948.1 phosphate ABC transporter substrate-binding/OmpA family protein [Aestuariirhabdus haliotis]